MISPEPEIEQLALVPSPVHKKLLNLTHDWLRTFMPHCLAKVNRVSFGLLDQDDTRRALAAALLG